MRVLLAVVIVVIGLPGIVFADEGTNSSKKADEQVTQNASSNATPPGVVIATPGSSATLLGVTPSDYPPPVVIVEGTVVNR